MMTLVERVAASEAMRKIELELLRRMNENTTLPCA